MPQKESEVQEEVSEKKKLYCRKCQRLKVEGEFYKSRNIEKYPPDGRVDICKSCMTMLINSWEPETFLPILEELDVPYIKSEWDTLLQKYSLMLKPEDFNGASIVGRYLAKMRLDQYRKYRWADSEALQKKLDEEKAESMRDRGVSEEEIAAQLEKAANSTVPIPESYTMRITGIGNIPSAATATNSLTLGLGEPVSPEDIWTRESEAEELGLTEEDTVYLDLKWSKQYTPREQVTMEQLYNDMCESYDIQTAGHKDTLKLLCKSSLKANQLIDAGDIEAYQKMSRVYDTLMKSGNFTAAQNKYASGNFVDSVGELVSMCERQGFIPKYYVAQPQDKADLVLLDYQRYVKCLIEEEMGLGDQIESAAKALEEARANELKVDEDNDADEDLILERELFLEKSNPLTDKDFKEFNQFEDDLEEESEDFLRRLMEGDE